MKQPKTIAQLQSEIISAENNVRQTGEQLVAAQRDAQRLAEQLAGAEQQIASLEAQNDALYNRLDSLYAQLDSLSDEEDEDGSRAAAIESEISSCQAEISSNQEEISDIKEEAAAMQQQLEALNQKLAGYAQILKGYRTSLQQTDQILVGHIEERSTVGVKLDRLSRMNYSASSAGQPAGRLEQEVPTCERERQRVAHLQDEITRYLKDGVKVPMPAAQKAAGSGGGSSGHGGAGRTPTGKGGQAPQTAPQTARTPAAGPSRIETARTTGASFAPPPVVSMKAPGGGATADVSDIQQLAQKNRGKWADEAGFLCNGAANAGKRTIRGAATLEGVHTIDDEATMEAYRDRQNEAGKKWFDSVKASGIGWRVHLRPSGTRYYMTSDSSSVQDPTRRASGNFLSREHPGNTARERVENLQLGTTNDGGRVEMVESTRATVVYESRVAPQKEWAEQCGYKARVGGKQTFTPTYDIKGALHAGLYRVVAPGEGAAVSNVRRAPVLGNAQRVALVMRRTDQKNRPQTTVEANGYTITTDEVTGTTVVRGELQNKKASRDGMPRNVGGSLKEAGDHRGHTVAARFNGPPIESNISSQHRDLNLGSYKRMENAEASLQKDGARIQTERIAYSSKKAADGSVRPEAYMVNDTITYKNGETRTVHLSFANLSNKEQDEMQRIVDEMYPPEWQHDELRGQLTQQEYNDLMREADEYVLDIKDEFTQSGILRPKAKRSKRSQ